MGPASTNKGLNRDDLEPNGLHIAFDDATQIKLEGGRVENSSAFVSPTGYAIPRIRSVWLHVIAVKSFDVQGRHFLVSATGILRNAVSHSGLHFYRSRV